MLSAGEYLLGVLAAALLCGVMMELAGKKGFSGSIVKLLCGFFLTAAVLSPLKNLELWTFDTIWEDLQTDAAWYAQEGSSYAEEKYREVIIKKTQAYILDKAQSLGASLTVEISLAEDSLAAPREITLRGNVSPYAKQVLSRWLVSELGVDTEAQKWIGGN